MKKRQYGQWDVRGAIENPVRGVYFACRRDCIEHYGVTADGRPINVVTNRTRTVVITIIDQ